MYNISSALHLLLTKGYVVDDRDLSNRPIMNKIVYKQN